jgi:outer membrane murein-binding lipoprotein Lpp
MLRWLGNALGLAGIRARLDYLIAQMEILMAKEADLQKDLDAIATGVTAAVSQIADLKAQIAALGTGPVSQEQLDALTAQADSIVAALTPNTP